MRGAAALAAIVLLPGCAAALREPPSIDALARTAPPAVESAASLVARADRLWSGRPDPGAVREAEGLYLRAAEADASAIEGLVGAIRTKAWLAEHEGDATVRETLASTAVDAGQWCERRAPDSASCAYWLAIALGLQARERPSTSKEGLDEMVKRLRRAAGIDPALDEAGPHRVLALVLLRAPGWPLGPGDPEAGLDEARRAVALRPEHPPNLLALAEGLEKAGDAEGAVEAADRALESARRRASSGDPDAPEWIRDARIAVGTRR